MRYKLNLLIVFSFLILLSFGKAENSAFEGRHFYIGFMQNDTEIEPTYGVHLIFYIATTEPANVQVLIPKEYPISLSLGADSVHRIDLNDVFQITDSETPLKKAIEIISDAPVTVYALNSQMLTSDSYSAIPVTHWGDEYVVMSMPNDQYRDMYNPTEFRLPVRNSEFMVLASYDSTVINFSPSAVTWANKQIGSNYEVNLQKGECYLVKSANTPIGTGDLTGTIVRGNKPFGLISGHVRTSCPQFDAYGQDSKDHIAEMLMPTKSWGRTFVTVPFIKDGYITDRYYNPLHDLIKITAINPNTIVTSESSVETKVYNLDKAGDAVSIFNVSQPTFWQANQPIQIGQIMQHDDQDPDEHSFYDPSLVMIPPVDQFVQSLIFATPGNTYNAQQYISEDITLIVSSDAVNSITFDGILLKDSTNLQYNRILNEPYYWANFQVSTGVHKITCDEGGFLGIMYGWGHVDSYAMILGSSLNNPFGNDTISPEFIVQEDCGRISGRITELDIPENTAIDFVSVIIDQTFNYKWDISPLNHDTKEVTFTAEPEDVFKDGMFTIDYRDKNGNGGRYEFIYNKIFADVPNKISLSDVRFDDSTCRDFKIVNYGRDTLHLDDINLIADSRIKIYTDSTIPVDIIPGGFMTINVCFQPNGDTSPVEGEILLDFDCDWEHTVEIEANVQLPEIETNHLDFGEVMVGDTACLELYYANTGNVDVELLDFKFNDPETGEAFFFDTSAIDFPYTVMVGDTLWVKACFTPKDTILYQGNIVCDNEADIQVFNFLSGRGVAPFIEPILVNWGNRRVGTQNDTTIIIQNIGNTEAIITLEQLIAETHSDDNSQKIQDFNLVIPKYSFVAVDFSYMPQTREPYNISAQLQTNWKLHPDLSIELNGMGTLPDLETKTIYFDTLEIFKTKTLNTTWLSTGGNEDLSITNAVGISGDFSQYNIDLAGIAGAKVPFGEDFNYPVEFAPKDTGYYELLIAINSNSMPNYGPRTDTVIVRGVAVPADTLNAIGEIRGETNAIACDSTELTFTIINKGNVSFRIEELKIVEMGQLFARLPDELSLPVILNEDESKSFGITYIGEKTIGLNQLTIEADIQYMDKKATRAVISETAEIIITPSEIFIDTLKAEAFQIGDSVSIGLSGVFVNKIEIFDELEFYLYYDIFNLISIDKTLEIEISGKNGEKIIPAVIFEDNNGLYIKASEKVMLQEGDTWQMELHFRVLLHTSIDPTIELEILSENCFADNSRIFNVDFGSICNFNLRSVTFITNLLGLRVSPNPASEEIELEVYVPNEETTDIEITNLTGIKHSLARKVALNKGYNSLKFEINSLPSGLYVLSLKGTKFNQQSMFIITK